MFRKFIIFNLIALFMCTHICSADQPFVMPEAPVMVIKTNYGSFEVVLFPQIAPKASENFIRLAQGGYYKNTPFHRIIPNFMVQSGDYTHRDGTGGSSIWGKSFQNEVSKDYVFDAPGKLAMANAGPDTNGSQFFITTVPTPWLNQKFTLFGQVIDGYETIKSIEALGTSTGSLRNIGSWWSPVYPEEPIIIDIFLKTTQ